MNSTKQAALITPIGSTDFCNRFIDAIGNIGDFSTLEMRINEKLVYSYPPIEYSKPSPELVNNFSRTEYANDNSINLIASIYLMKPDTIYNHAKVSFFLVLLGTVISVLLLVIFKEEPKAGFEAIYAAKKDSKSDKKNDDSSDLNLNESAKLQDLQDSKEEVAVAESAELQVAQPVAEEKPAHTHKSNAKTDMHFSQEAIFPKVKTEEIKEPEKIEETQDFENDVAVIENDYDDTISDRLSDEEVQEIENATIDKPAEKKNPFENLKLVDDDSLTINFDEIQPEDYEKSNENETSTQAEPVAVAKTETVTPVEPLTETAKQTVQTENVDISEFQTPVQEKPETMEENFEPEDDIQFVDETPEPLLTASEPEIEQNEPEIITEENNGFIKDASLIEPDLRTYLNDSDITGTDVTVCFIKIEQNLEENKKILLNIQNSLSAENGIYACTEDIFAVLVKSDIDSTYRDIGYIFESSKDIFVGVVSKNTREISAADLLEEATKVLGKATSDPENPIAVFKVDPEKYRQYILAKNGK